MDSLVRWAPADIRGGVRVHSAPKLVAANAAVINADAGLRHCENCFCTAAIDIQKRATLPTREQRARMVGSHSSSIEMPRSLV